MNYRFWTIIFINLLILVGLIYDGCSRSRDQKGNESERILSEAKYLLNQHKYPEAIEKFRNAIALNTEMAVDSALGESYLQFGGCWEQIGKYDSAEDYYKKALQTFRATGDKKLERRAKITLAEFYLSMSEYMNASALAADAATIAKIFSDPMDEYRALNIAAKAYHNGAKYDDEIYNLNSLINLDTLLYKSQNKYDLMLRILLANESSGRHDLASSVFEKLKSQTIADHNDSAYVKTLFEWGKLQQSSSHPDSSLRAFSLAVSKMDDRMDVTLRKNILMSLGAQAYRSKHFDDAKMYFTDGLALLKKAGNPGSEKLLQLMVVASDWKIAGERSAKLASDFLNRCEVIFSSSKEIGYKPAEAFALFLQAGVKEKSGDTTRVLAIYNQSWQLYDESFWLFDNKSMEIDLITTFMDVESSSWYVPLFRYYYSNGNADDLFNLAENKNLRELTSYFSRLHIKRLDDKANQAIADVQWKYRKAEALEKNIVSEITIGKERNNERIQYLENQLAQYRTEVSNTIDRLESVETNFKWLLDKTPPVKRNLQDSLDVYSALIEYIPLSDRLLVLILTRDTLLVRTKEIPRQQLLNNIEELERLLDSWHAEGEIIIPEKPASVFRIEELSAKLGSILLEPIMQSQKNISKLYLVPPLEFGWLPIHGLKVDGKPVVEKFSVNYLPTSAGLLFARKDEGIIQNIVGIGNPGSTNWDVEYELNDIRSFFENAKMAFDLSSPLTYLDTATYDLVHFAVEYKNDVNVPDNSHFYLSDVKKLYGGNNISLGEMVRMSPPQAIVFSNISTKAGEFFRYAPLAFLADGTPTVIGTMWQGDRKAKKYFGEMFYTSLKAGLPASQAYHDAITALQKKQEFSQLNRWGLFYKFGK